MEGDEVLTVAMGFPTTVNPIIQNRLKPVLVDVELAPTTPTPTCSREAIGPRTRAIMMAHTLGNPFDLDTVKALCKEHGLWLVEDSCDALGSTYDGKRTGSFGDTATASFYPAHHITTGEGGAVFVRSPLVKKQVESFRDWGRDCYCETGHDNTCLKRFEWELGDLPEGYDHKYIYGHIGYNLKAHGHAGRPRGFPADPNSTSSPIAGGRTSATCMRPLRTSRADPAQGNTQVRPVVVRLPDHTGSEVVGRSRGPAAVPRCAEGRHAAHVRGQHHPPTRIQGRRLPDRVVAGCGRHRDAPDLLGRHLPGPYPSDAGLHRGLHPRVRHEGLIVRYLVTGHTGFKGAWLSLWLAEQGHEVVGLALDPRPGGIFERAAVAELLTRDVRLDVRDADAVAAVVARPDLTSSSISPRSHSSESPTLTPGRR